MFYYNHLGFNKPDFYDNDTTESAPIADDHVATVSIRKCNPEIAAYLKAQYGDKLPADVEFWEKLPTPSDNRYWIDALSEQAMKDDADDTGYGDPLVDQYHITNIDFVDVIRQLGKLIDAKKQEISERGNGRMAGTSQGQKDSAYLTGQMDGLRTAIKVLQGDNEFTVGESKCDVYRRTCERIYSLPWRTNSDDDLFVHLEKTTYREWLRELNEVMDNETVHSL